MRDRATLNAALHGDDGVLPAYTRNVDEIGNTCQCRDMEFSGAVGNLGPGLGAARANANP